MSQVGVLPGTERRARSGCVSSQAGLSPCRMSCHKRATTHQRGDGKHPQLISRAPDEYDHPVSGRGSRTSQHAGGLYTEAKLFNLCWQPGSAPGTRHQVTTVISQRLVSGSALIRVQVAAQARPARTGPGRPCGRGTVWAGRGGRPPRHAGGRMVSDTVIRRVPRTRAAGVLGASGCPRGRIPEERRDS